MTDHDNDDDDNDDDDDDDVFLLQVDDNHTVHQWLTSNWVEPDPNDYHRTYEDPSIYQVSSNYTATTIEPTIQRPFYLSGKFKLYR